MSKKPFDKFINKEISGAKKKEAIKQEKKRVKAELRAEGEERRRRRTTTYGNTPVRSRDTFTNTTPARSANTNSRSTSTRPPRSNATVQTTYNSNTPVRSRDTFTNTTPARSANTNSRSTSTRPPRSNATVQTTYNSNTPVRSRDTFTNTTPARSANTNSRSTSTRLPRSNATVQTTYNSNTPVRSRDTFTNTTPVRSANTNSRSTPTRPPRSNATIQTTHNRTFATDYQETTPAKRETSNVKREMPNVKREMPNVKGETSNVKREMPNVKRETSNVKRETSNVKRETSNVKRQTSNVKREMPNVKRETSNVKREAVSEMMPLNKYLAHSGVCARREAAEIVKHGKVIVNGQQVTEPGFKVSTEDIVSVNGKKLFLQHNLIYILLNKPKDHITTVNDPEGRKTVLDLVANAVQNRVFPVGRLDRNTTGVLLMTNDGELTQKLTHPSFEIKKVYEVKLDKPLTKKDFDTILKGVTLEDGIATADALAYVDVKDKTVIGIEIHSGKNRIVRRIFECFGYSVKNLDRVMFANLTKKNVTRGKWRLLNEKEVRLLKYMNQSFVRSTRQK